MRFMIVACSLFLLSVSLILNELSHPVTVASSNPVAIASPTPVAVATPKVYLESTCPTDTPPEPRKLYKKDSSGYEFSWISDANLEKSGGWCYFNGFKNLHPTTVAEFDFKPARMKIVMVPPNGEDVNMVESQPPYEYPVKAFDLFYASLKSTRADLIRPQLLTAMIDPSGTIGGGLANATARSRIDTSMPIRAEIRYDLRDPQTKVDYKVLVALTSSVKREDKKYRYSFSMVNQGKDTLRFEWEAVTKTYDPAFMEILKNAFFQGRRTDLHGIELKGGENFEITPLTGKSPEIIPGVINIYRNNTFLAQGFAPAFIPGRDW